MPDVTQLDSMPDAAAAGLFRACCGASRWVAAMVARRPFESREALHAAADEIWMSLRPADWQEAFRHHPRIGERQAAVAQDRQGRHWSTTEQAGIGQADHETRRMIADLNVDYERRFGYIYLVDAAGRDAGELLSLARGRLTNAPDLELRVAAREQQQIMHRRLDRLLDGTPAGKGEP